MSTELFPQSSVTQPSPRLLWMKKHNLHTCFADHLKVEDEPWTCYHGDSWEAFETDNYSTGKTEDESIVNWAKDHNVKLWNEETV